MIIRELITVNIDDEHDDIIGPEDLFNLIIFKAITEKRVNNEVIMFHYNLRDDINAIINIPTTKFIIIDQFGNYTYITSPPFTNGILNAISGEIRTYGIEAFQNLGKPINNTCMTPTIMDPFKNRYDERLNLNEINEISKEILVSFIMDGYTILYLTNEDVHCCTNQLYNNKKGLIKSYVTDLYNLKTVFKEVMSIYKSNPQKIIDEIQNRKKKYDELMLPFLKSLEMDKHDTTQ